MDRSDREKKVAALIEQKIAEFRRRKPNFIGAARELLDDSEREANKWYRKYHELKDELERLITS